MKNLTDSEKAWIAGIIDADGSIILRERNRGGYAATAKVSNNDEGVIQKLQELIPEGRTYEREEDEYDSELWYQFVVAKQSVLYSLLKEVQEDLASVKSEKAELVQEYLEVREEQKKFGEKEDAIYNRFTSLS